MAWKWDMTLWDRDRWMAGVGRIFHRLDDGSIVIRVSTSNEQSWFNDVYVLEQEYFIFRTEDGGLNWDLYDGPLIDDNATRLSDGTVVRIYSGGATTLEQKKELLASIGANPDTAKREGNDLWPESRNEELDAQGYVVETSIPGIVGTLTALTCARSQDGGKTFEYRRVEGLPELARMYGSFRRCIQLSDGSILAACVGRRRRDSTEFSFVLRSGDGGDSWSFHPAAEDDTESHQWNETEIIELPNGRVLAMMRHHGAKISVGDYLWQCFSDDGGKTWGKPVQTPIWGYPPQLILLKSGKLLCTYAHRRHPYGVRACLSHDLGETWDYENEKVIRDDSMMGLVWYPTSIQLEDETILTGYSISKIPRVPYRSDDSVDPRQDLVIHARKRVGEERHWYGGFHGYAAVSRYTEDFVRPRGQTTNRTMFDETKDVKTRTGHDEE